MESLLVSLVVLAVVCVVLYYIATLLPQPLQKILQILVIAGAAIWLLTHLRAIIAVIAGS